MKQIQKETKFQIVCTPFAALFGAKELVPSFFVDFHGNFHATMRSPIVDGMLVPSFLGEF